MKNSKATEIKPEDLIESKNFVALKCAFVSMNEVDIARLLQTIEDEITLVKAFKLLTKDMAAEVFAEIEIETQQKLITYLSSADISQLINEMSSDDAVDFLEELPANVVEHLLKTTSKETRETINKLLNYPEHSAGSIMTTEMIDLRKDLTIEEALKRVRKKGMDVETINIMYVISPQRNLEGVVTIRKLLTNDPKTKIEDIMEHNVIFATTHTDREDVAHLFTKYNFPVLPIVDSEQKLVGVVTSDDIIHVIKDEATEDMQKIMAIKPIDKPYLKTSAWKHAKSRIGWLVVLSLSAIFTGAIITTFEEALLVMPILMSFIPMLMDTGGNCGAQSSTVVIRGMALNEIKTKDFFKVIRKEFLVATICGIVVGGINFLRIVIQYGFAKWDLALVVWLGLWTTMVISKFLGAMLPTLAKKLKLDPALMSAPLITTISDILGLVCFFGFAMLILAI